MASCKALEKMCASNLGAILPDICELILQYTEGLADLGNAVDPSLAYHKCEGKSFPHERLELLWPR